MALKELNDFGNVCQARGCTASQEQSVDIRSENPILLYDQKHRNFQGTAIRPASSCRERRSRPRSARTRIGHRIRARRRQRDTQQSLEYTSKRESPVVMLTVWYRLNDFQRNDGEGKNRADEGGEAF